MSWPTFAPALTRATPCSTIAKRSAQPYGRGRSSIDSSAIGWEGGSTIRPATTTPAACFTDGWPNYPVSARRSGNCSPRPRKPAWQSSAAKRIPPTATADCWSAEWPNDMAQICSTSAATDGCRARNNSSPRNASARPRANSTFSRPRRPASGNPYNRFHKKNRR